MLATADRIPFDTRARGTAFPFLATLSAWVGRSSQRRTLAALEPAQLKDIGVDLFAARAEAAKPFWRA
jgi:uncharacterized protein YjiS (DUF1127 family)